MRRDLIDRYGAAIEADLHAVYGMDILDFFRGVHSWRKFDVLVNALPVGSHFWAAMADDDDAASDYLQCVGAEGVQAAPKSAPLTEMSTTNQLLMDVVDGLQLVRAQVCVSMGGEKPQGIAPVPRPETGMSRAKLRAMHAEADSLLAEVTDAQTARKALGAD